MQMLHENTNGTTQNYRLYYTKLFTDHTPQNYRLCYAKLQIKLRAHALHTSRISHVLYNNLIVSLVLYRSVVANRNAEDRISGCTSKDR